MNQDFTSIEARHRIFKEVKPLFISKLGKYTHQRISGDWHFRGLGFVQGHMTYVFGFNIGFFKKDENSAEFDKVGMNVLVRTNGYKSNVRKKFDDFFREILKDWYTHSDIYTSFRGGEGSEFSRYLSIEECKSEKQIVEFLKETITQLSKAYPDILNNHNLFKEVLRAGFPWHDTIGDLAEHALK